MSPTDDHVKIRFPLEQDEDGWPPAESEGIWAVPIGDDTYRIDNVPWFATDLAVNDEVKAIADADGKLWATELVTESGHMTIRVLPYKDGPLGGDLQKVIDTFSPLGIAAEGIEQFGLVALDIPPGLELGPIKTLLEEGESSGSWAYEEGCVSDDWLEL